jgi:ubiquinone/menaquinone biosynthesis C-methylase UbiE
MIRGMVFSTHKEKWEKLAKENANYYVWSESESASESKYRKSGNINVKKLILKDPLIRAMGRKKSLNFLEIGCGNGRMTEFIAKKFAQVFAVDISHEMLNQARKRLNKLVNVHYLESNGNIFEIEKNSIDVAFSFIVFQHMPEEKMVEDNFSLIRDALKPQGLFKVQLRGYKCKENQWFSGVAYDISKVKKLVEKTGLD